MLDFKFADIGEGIHEGTILKWLVKEGDEVKDGDTLCLVETDKVNAEIPSPVNGKIIKLMAEVGDNIEVGDVLVKIDDGSADTDSTKTEEESAGVIGEIEVSSEVIASSYEQESSKTETIGKVLATPVARKLAKDLGVDITQVKGTGIQGRVMKEDIYHAKEVTSTKPQFDAPKLEFTEAVERVKVSKLRKTIAKNMVLAKSIIPHTTSMDEFDVTDLVKFRKEHKEMARANNIHLTYLPFIIKAVVLTLKEYRILNSSYDQENEEIIYKNYYNIGIAVDTDDGLIKMQIN